MKKEDDNWQGERGSCIRAKEGARGGGEREEENGEERCIERKSRRE